MTQQTNEEKKVVYYSETESPTVSSTVTKNTPLKELNLNWRETDLPEKNRTKHVHRLHPYLGKFIPQLVEIFLRKYFNPEETVLDPFCGSGTTLVQANELGINSLGSDISAFNILLSQAKLANYDIAKAKWEIYDILKKTRKITRDYTQLDLFDADLVARSVQTTNDYLLQWFAPQARKELLTYRDLIETGQYEYKDLLKIILSRSARSARLVTHFDLDFPKTPQTTPYWCYKHSRNCEPTKEAYKFLDRYSIDTISRIAEFANVRTKASWRIIHGDSKTIEYPQIDGVITSPPYVGLIDYHRQHEYAYQLLDLENRSETEIGPASNGSSQKAIELYKAEITAVFKNCVKSIKKGGRLIVIAGDKRNLYNDIAAEVGVETEAVIQRHVNRRTGRRLSAFYESVFIWQVE